MLFEKKFSAKYIIVIVAVSVLALCCIIYTISLSNNKTLSKNLGLSHMTINGSEVSPDIDSVVPTEKELLDNLTDEGYSIKQYDKIQSIDASVKRILAEKGNSFIDICYGLSISDTKLVFKYYEDTYEEYYLLAQNENYVYCIRDKKTFKNAGFKSLANNGIQYIYE